MLARCAIPLGALLRSKPMIKLINQPLLSVRTGMYVMHTSRSGCSIRCQIFRTFRYFVKVVYSVTYLTLTSYKCDIHLSPSHDAFHPLSCIAFRQTQLFLRCKVSCFIFATTPSYPPFFLSLFLSLSLSLSPSLPLSLSLSLSLSLPLSHFPPIHSLIR